MIKKAIVGTGVLVVIGVLVFGTEVVSYVRTSAGVVSDAVHDNVPIEFQIERARDLIEDLVPDIRRALHVIAKEQVEVERLESEIADSEASLENAEQQMVQLRDDLESGKETFVYNRRSYTVSQVKADLANRLDRCRTAKATLETKRQIYDARLKKLDAAREKLDGMLSERSRLQVEVEHLEARLKMLAAAQTTSDYKVDDTKLARAKELISDLRTRLDVAERLVNAETNFHDEIPPDEAAPENIVEQVTEYFGDEVAQIEVAATD